MILLNEGQSFNQFHDQFKTIFLGYVINFNNLLIKKFLVIQIFVIS